MYKVRIYDAATDKIAVHEVTLGDIIYYPIGYNMADVGLILLNRLRQEEGLDPIPTSSIADNIEEFEKRGTNE